MACCTSASFPFNANASTVKTSCPATIGNKTRQLLKGTNREPVPYGFTSNMVQAPHSPSAQPSFEPVNPWARTKSSSVVGVGTAAARIGFPLSSKAIDVIASHHFDVIVEWNAILMSCRE